MIQGEKFPMNGVEGFRLPRCGMIELVNELVMMIKQLIVLFPLE